ncbi:MAG TPA: peptide deformylase [Trueperaceae bacterium]|nr:peptide deformylase [Trueperaceae bacterium]
MIYPILYYGEPILRRRARPVERFDDDLAALAADMFETMYAADGVGLAAPQIGLDKRLFVALEVDRDDQDDDSEEMAGQLADAEPIEDATEDDAGGEDEPEAKEELTEEQKRRAWGVVREHVIVNPVIQASSGRQLARDGCLSLPGLVAEGVPRPKSVTLEYQDLTGANQSLGADGYFAHVLQHEFDHLEGVLYFDHLPSASREAFLEEHRALLAEWQRLAKSRAKSAAAQVPARARQFR